MARRAFVRSDSRIQRRAPAVLRLLLLALGGLATAWLFIAGLRFLPIAGTPGDSGLVGLYAATWIVAALLAVRGLQRAATRRRRLAEAEDGARQSDRLAQLIAALAAARTPAAAAEAAVLEPLQALDADA